MPVAAATATEHDALLEEVAGLRRKKAANEVQLCDKDAQLHSKDAEVKRIESEKKRIAQAYDQLFKDFDTLTNICMKVFDGFGRIRRRTAQAEKNSRLNRPARDFAKDLTYETGQDLKV